MNARRAGYRLGVTVLGGRHRLGAVALAAVLLAGCGSGAETLTADDAAALHGQVDTIRTAIADGRTGAARKAVADLRTAIRRLADTGELDPADGLVLLTQVDRIEQEIARTATPTPVPTPTPAPAPDPEPQDNTQPEPKKDGPKDKPKGPGKNKGKGKGKGKGNG